MAKVLLIDDEIGFTTLVRVNLALDGKHGVEVVNDPLLAMETAARFQPDVIILDLIMPGMDGGDVASRLRDDPALSKIPIIFLTALVSPGEVTPGAIALSGDYPLLPKPVDIELLEQCIEEVLEKAALGENGA